MATTPIFLPEESMDRGTRWPATVHRVPRDISASCFLIFIPLALGDSEGPGSLVCCSPWHHKEADTTE